MSLPAVLAACAVLACGLTAQAQQVVERPAFFRDVPGPPKARGDAGADDHPHLNIFHGDVAARTQFPYQAAMYIDLSVFCGGSLINEKWVLTAAHCVDGGTTWYVLLGVTESLSPVQDGRKTYVTRGAYKHPSYDKYNIVNDVGLVQLMRPAALSQYIQTITLTPAGVSYIGQTATVSGFGRTDDANASPISPVLRYTSLPIVDGKVCSAAYGQETGSDPSVICLKAEGSSSCKGDSGGPLTLKNAAGELIQVGIVSFGAAAGCSYGKPVGYSNVAYLLPWISQTTGLDFS